MEKDNRNFGQEVGDELISGLPMAMGLTRVIFGGMAKGTQMLRDKILTEDELREIQEEEAEKQRDGSESSGIIGSLKAVHYDSMQTCANLWVAGCSLARRVIKKLKERK